MLLVFDSVKIEKHVLFRWGNNESMSLCVTQSDDTDGTTANDDEALHQQPNNTRAPVCGASGPGTKQSPRDLALSTKARCSKLRLLTASPALCPTVS